MSPSLIEKILPLGLTSEVHVIFFIAASLLASAMCCVFILFGSRIVKSHRAACKHLLQEQYQGILNKIIFNEGSSPEDLSAHAFEFYMAELRLIAGSSSFSRRELIKQILALKRNLTGNASQALVETYYALELYQESLASLRRFAWHRKVSGMHELAEMGYVQGVPVIARLLDSRNRTLREESVTALMRLEEHPLSFLNHYRRDLSLWMRLNIHNYLSKLDDQKLPVFSEWFGHKNQSIRLFSISMARQFRQNASLPGLVELLYSADAKTVRLAVTTIGELQGHEHRAEIARLASHVWRFEGLAIAVLRCLANIGDVDVDLATVEKYLSHPLYSVRYEAVAALKKMGPGAASFLDDFNAKNCNKIDSLLRHFSEPLLA